MSPLGVWRPVAIPSVVVEERASRGWVVRCRVCAYVSGVYWTEGHARNRAATHVVNAHYPAMIELTKEEES